MKRAALLLLAIAAVPGRAEVVFVAPDGFVLRHEGVMAAAPDAAWNALVDWGGWWPDAHSYSGKAANLELDVEPAGELEEEWEGGAVLHGMVLQATPSKLLRLAAPLGPLQALPVNAVLDFTLKPEGTGTRLTLSYRVGGPASLDLGKLATPVDGVMAQAFARLLAHRAPASRRKED
jgi:uncharacterized protein YndB with AHSA1/START domain